MSSMSDLGTRLFECRSSAISGILSAWASLPFDNAKTKIQKMTANADGTFPYKNIFDAMGKVYICLL